MKNILYILTFFLIISCNDRPKTVKYFDEEIGEYVIDTLPYNDIRDFPSIKASKSSDSLIAGIIKQDYVFEKYIGIGGAYPEQYARFERLTELLTEKQMLELTRHENPVVRVYAFKGLLNEKSEFVNEAIKILEKDTTKFSHGAGCMLGTYRVSEYIKQPE